MTAYAVYVALTAIVCLIPSFHIDGYLQVWARA